MGDVFTFRKIILLIALVAGPKLASQATAQRLDDSLLVKFDFQKGFNREYVSFRVNGYKIFDTVQLSSNPIVDFTSFTVKLIQALPNEIIVRFEDSIAKIPTLKLPLTIEVIINGCKSKQKLDLKKGKYIGISLGVDKKMTCIQWQRPFFYD